MDWSPTNDPVFKILLQHNGASTLLHVKLSCPVDVEDGWEVLRVAIEEILRWVSGDKLVTEFKNLEKRSSSPTSYSLQPAR